jgi:hypothetical protein
MSIRCAAFFVVFGTVCFPPVGVLRLHLLFLAVAPALQRRTLAFRRSLDTGRATRVRSINRAGPSDAVQFTLNCHTNHGLIGGKLYPLARMLNLCDA